MTNLFKIFFNIILYIIYVVIFSFVVGILIGLILNYYDKTLIEEPLASYIQAGLAIFVLFITVIYRKYFYISLDNEEKIKYNIETIIEKKEKEEEKIHIKTKNKNNDDLEIIIGKE